MKLKAKAVNPKHGQGREPEARRNGRRPLLQETMQSDGYNVSFLTN